MMIPETFRRGTQLKLARRLTLGLSARTAARARRVVLIRDGAVVAEEPDSPRKENRNDPGQ